MQKWAISNFSDFHHDIDIWADDQAPVCNMYVTLLHVIIWDNQYNILCVASTTMYVCRHNTSTIFSSCSPKTISVNVTKSFWIPSDILLFSFLRPLLCYAMLWHVHVISVSWHADVTGYCLHAAEKSEETQPESLSDESSFLPRGDCNRERGETFVSNYVHPFTMVA